MEKREEIKIKKGGKISEFFSHMVAYGGFSFEQGTMKIWGDPSIFIPITGFLKIVKIMEEKIGKEKTNDILYWLGRLYGKNSTLMLMKRFGFKKEDIAEFVNGATQDGFGKATIVKQVKILKKDYEGTIIVENPIYAKEYLKQYGKQKDPVDFYLLGILCGGAEPLYERIVNGKETECACQEKKYCKYELKTQQNKIKFKFFKDINLEEDDLIKRTKSNALKRNSKFKIFGGKEISFGDGSFILRGHIGINFPIYGWSILEEIIYQFLGKERYQEFLKEIANEYLKSIGINKQKVKTITRKELEKKLKEIEVFCLGKIEIKNIIGKKILLKNYDNYFYDEKKKIKIDLKKETITENLIKEIFKECFNKKINIKKGEKRETEGTILCIELLDNIN